MKKDRRSILGLLQFKDGKNRKFENLVINLALQQVASARFQFDGKAVYTADRAVLVYQLADEAKVVVPEGVKEIGRMAVVRHGNLARLVLPSTIEKIGKEAFAGCSKLETVTIPAAVKRVCGHAFAHCEGLKEVTFEGIPQHIGKKTFDECASLRVIRVPESCVEHFRKRLHLVLGKGVEIVERKLPESPKPQPKPEPKEPVATAKKVEQTGGK